MSDAVVDQPVLTRSEWSASAPIAASTGDGSSDSDEQAEPECTAMPCWSSASRIGSASTPATVTHVRSDSPPAGSPSNSMPGTCPSAARRACVPARRPHLVVERGFELGHGGAEPDDRGDVLDAAPAVPLLRATDDERRDPQIRVAPPARPRQGVPPRVRGHARQVGADGRDVEIEVADRRARVDVDEDATLAGAGADLLDRLQRADLVVGELDADERGGGVDGVDHGHRVELAVTVDADGHRLERLAGQASSTLECSPRWSRCGSPRRCVAPRRTRLR